MSTIGLTPEGENRDEIVRPPQVSWSEPANSSRRQLAVSTRDRKLKGIVYTPRDLADYVANKTISFYLEDQLCRNAGRAHNTCGSIDVRHLRILDPACGDGELLVAIWLQLVQKLSEHFGNQDVLRAIDPVESLCGIDMDHGATRSTKLRIEALSGVVGHRNRHAKVLNTNALFPFNQKRSMKGWKQVCRRFDAPEGFDIIIANPPWGADIASYKDKLSREQFSLYQGQFDTSDLFLELAISIVKPGGYFAFIIPDSLFNLERTTLRRMLLIKTDIRFIGRFGEKFFENVNRACAVIICKNSQCNRNSETECLRLTPEARRKIIEKNMTFEEAEQLLGHRISQKRLRQNPAYRFDIDVTVQDEKLIQVLHELPSTFGDYLRSSRGVELSKRGRVCRCEACGLWLPLPKASRPKCPHCKSELLIKPSDVVCIVSKEKSNGYRPFLAGESIRRYSINYGLWIAINKSGITFKDELIYRPPKLLVRKTGVGISAAIDYSNAYTNQVVYILRLRDDIDDQIPLEFFLGVINSRAIYYFLVKNHGETEWRSHPYVTQRQVLELPLPNLKTFRNKKSGLVESMVRIIRPFSRKNQGLRALADARVEYLVAQLYGLKKRDYNLIYATLNSVEELLPVRALRRIRIGDIFPT